MLVIAVARGARRRPVGFASVRLLRRDRPWHLLASPAQLISPGVPSHEHRARCKRERDVMADGITGALRAGAHGPGPGRSTDRRRGRGGRLGVDRLLVGRVGGSERDLRRTGSYGHDGGRRRGRCASCPPRAAAWTPDLPEHRMARGRRRRDPARRVGGEPVDTAAHSGHAAVRHRQRDEPAEPLRGRRPGRAAPPGPGSVPRRVVHDHRFGGRAEPRRSRCRRGVGPPPASTGRRVRPGHRLHGAGISPVVGPAAPRPAHVCPASTRTPKDYRKAARAPRGPARCARACATFATPRGRPSRA